ncbi:MAG: DUF4236 domain-containing protein [Xanthomonadales bacterium]|nr:DUF4236 domain-containing protein [Xanthomonadales bacterium]
MGWRFRKSFSPLPGVRLTLSPRGVSTSVGAGPLRFTVGPQGAAVTSRIPGTGIALRQPITPRFATGQGTVSDRAPLAPTIPNEPPQVIATGQGEIRSAGTSELTSPGLSKFRELLAQAQQERRRLLPEVRAAVEEAIRLERNHAAWQRGWLLRRLFPGRYARIQENATEAKARRDELREQEKLSRLQTQIDLPAEARKVYGQLLDAFAIVTKCECKWDTVSRVAADRVRERTTASHSIDRKSVSFDLGSCDLIESEECKWDTVSRVAADRVRERTTASHSIDRKSVSFDLGSCDLIESEWRVPHLANANGGDLYFYPGFVLLHISADAFALVDVAEVAIEAAIAAYIEEETVPSDTRIMQQTWKKANKDGSPDRRFADNYQIPVVEYAKLTITSPSGLNEEYMLSNFSAVAQFSSVWKAFRQVVAGAAA